MKYTGVICLCLALTSPVAAQNDLSTYLAGHRYAFSLEKGFDQTLSDTLTRKLSGFRLILQAEGASHDLQLYNRLEFVWLQYLQQRFGLTHFIGESGHASAVLFNRFLATGDTTLLLYRSRFWEDLFAFNRGLPESRKLHYIGVDFDWPGYYFHALKVLLPDMPAPEAIRAEIDLIRGVPDSMRDCAFTIGFNARLKKAVEARPDEYKSYFGQHFSDLLLILENRSDCKDRLKNRNPKMAARFMEFHRLVGDSLYFGEFGEAHTTLNTNDLAAMINRTEGFRGGVCVINLYCYHCSVPGEVLSNWPLRKIEEDLRRYFLPLCNGDLTLFDLSGPGDIIKPYRDLGQFLIIAKDQL